MDKQTVFTPRIVRHSVTSLKMTRLAVFESNASTSTSKFKREGKAVLIAAGFCLAIWVLIVWVALLQA